MIVDWRRQARAALSVAMLATVGCAQPDPGGADEALACIGNDPSQVGVEQAHGFSAPVPIRFRPAARAAGTSRVVYLNRSPRSYVAGLDDAQAGSSSVLTAKSLAKASLSGFVQGDDAWREVVECIREQYAEFDIAVTDIRPVTGGFIEAHFGGKGPEIGVNDGSGGIAPIDSGSCGVIDGAVVFVFSDLFGTNLRSICEVGAHEIGHAFSLDHELRCKDPMTYIQGCGEKEFQLDDAPCGEGSARDCICGRPSQNSVEILQVQLGGHRSDVIPPVVELMPPVPSPSGRYTLLQVRAHDPDAALDAVELHVVTDGVEQVSRCGDHAIPCTLDGELASFALLPSASDQRVWAVAEDTGGNRTASLEVVVPGGAPSVAELALAVAPVASRYVRDGVVEVQALVVSPSPVVEAVAVWTDGDGNVRELPLCSQGDDGRYGVAIRLGGGEGVRSFRIRVRDEAGHVLESEDEAVRLAESV